MQKHGKFMQTKNACIVKEPPLAPGEETEEVKDVEMRDGSSGSASNLDTDVSNLPFKDKEITVLYFGAGRGPLIRRALAAAKQTKANVKIIALDKNPNAIVTLRNMIIDENLQDRVKLVSGDMRHI